MPFQKNLCRGAKTLILSAIYLTGFTLFASADEKGFHSQPIRIAMPQGLPSCEKPTGVVDPDRIYLENFNSDDKILMMGGQLNFNFPHRRKTNWYTNVIAGKLVFENRENAGNLHYDEISWVRYEGEDKLTPTKNAQISVSVEPINQSHGAAGILLGSGKKGYYLMFGVDKEGRYHIIEKKGNISTPLYSGRDDAIRMGQANRLHHENKDDLIVFFANGVELVSVPFNKRRDREISLAAFGLGTFSFDDVEIKAGIEDAKCETAKDIGHKLPKQYRTKPSNTF